MGRNAVRIVCNPYNNQISYYFMNEKGVWTVLSGDSPLSRQYYTNTTMKDRAKEIALKIDEVYNRSNRGLDVLFEGTSQSYDYIKGAFEYYLPDRDIVCSIGVTKIAVVGKTNVGKTCLIEGMESLQGYKYSVNKFPDYQLYRDEGNHAEWFEINGIDLGIENVEKACRTVTKLTENGLSVIVYCVSAATGRLEEVERDFVLKMIEEHPSITILLAITVCIKADSESIVNEIEKITDQVKVIPTLAKEYEIESIDESTGEEKSYVKKPFGLDALSKYVFERR